MKIVTLVSLWLALLAASARGEGVLIANPLEAFVYGKYDLGDEYFISGNQNTFIFRCVLTEGQNGIDGIALSEISIWGNHGGPWEIFRKKKSGSFAYVGTRKSSPTPLALRHVGQKIIWQPVTVIGSRDGPSSSFNDASPFCRIRF